MDHPLEQKVSLPVFISLEDARSRTSNLPEELKNEPFAFRDTGRRMEVRVQRPRFLYYISDDGLAHCNVHGYLIEDEDAPIHDLAQLTVEKRESTVSALSVYDTYGLAIARQYLEYIYRNKYLALAPEWLLVYLYGCLDELEEQEEFDWNTSPDHVLSICQQILDALTRLDENEPALPSPLSDVPVGTLPLDLLARTLGSIQLSRNIAREVMHQRCASEPTYEELLAESDYESTGGLVLSIDGVYVVGDERHNPVVSEQRTCEQFGTNLGTCEQFGTNLRTCEQRALARDEARFLYTFTADVPLRDYEEEDEVLQFSLLEYQRVFSARGCPEYSSMGVLLRRLRRDTSPTEENVDKICRWVLSLTNFFDERRENVIYENIYSLAEELDRLIELALEYYDAYS